MQLKWNDDGRIKSPLARARNYGSAKSGVHHWTHHRITALSNLVLVIWLMWSILTIPAWDYQTATSWLAQPVNAVLMILFVLSTFYHAVLGVQVVVEDYIHCEAMKVIKIAAQRLFFFALGVTCVFSVLKVAL